MTRAPSVAGAPRPSATSRRRTISLLFLAVLALGAGLALTQPGAPRAFVALAGALLAFGLPGVALTRAMFPGPGMGRTERITLALGMQFGLVILTGFLLQLLPSGLSAASWGAILTDITLIACAVAWIRARAIPQDDPAPATGSADPSGVAVGPSDPGWLAALAALPTRQLAMLIGAVILAASALAVARAGVAWQPQTAWTALAIEPADGGRSVAVNVTNAEGQPETYRMEATIDGEPLTTIAALPLSNGAAAIETIQLPAAGALLRQVDVSLWRSSDAPDAAPYRSVRLSLRGEPGP